MRMLFIYPDVRTNQFAHIQHGVASISAVLKAAGHQTDLVWFREEISEDEFVEMVREKKPDVAGFSSSTQQWPFTKRYARALKNSEPSLPLVIGGVHASLASEDVMAENIFDILCRGEGELAMRDLMDALEHGKDFREIQNLWVRHNDQVIQNPLRDWIDPLDDMPFPDRTIWDNDLILYENDHEAALMASRGCPYACTYCSNSALRKLVPGSKRHLRIKSPEYLIEEIEDLCAQLEVRSLFFEDEIFTLKRRWVERFCDLYKQRFDMPFIIYVRQELVDREQLEMLKEAGCTAIKLGVETGNEKQRREVLNRKTTNQEIIEFFHTAHQVGLKTWIFNMVGIPGDTPEIIEQGMDLNRIVKANHVQVTVFYPYPGTPLYELCKREGYISERDSTSVFNDYSVLNLPTISPDQIHEYFIRFRKLAFEIAAEREALGYFDFTHHFTEARVETGNPDFVQLMPVRVNGVERMCLLEHPSSSVTYRVKLRPGSSLRFGMAFSPAVWDKPGGGTTFEVHIKAGRFRRQKIFQKFIDPKNRLEDREWHDHEVDLSRFGEREVEVKFITHTPPGENQYCVAVWSRPHLVVPEGSAGRDIHENIK
jgi:anaerobic magnesium-protoporphyrin IX monomethyl ester cyclase